VITRSKLVGVVVAGWVLVSLLPWWQLRVEYADQSGTGTRTYSADVWRASTPAALAGLGLVRRRRPGADGNSVGCDTGTEITETLIT
jgi:hypothetical protein